MLLIGNTPCNESRGMSCNNLTHDEERTNMAIWNIASAPLQISVDVKAVPAASKAILQNKEIIAVGQDPLGRMGFRFMKNESSGAQGWKKELLGGSVAVVLLNMGGGGSSAGGGGHGHHGGGGGVPPPAGVDNCGWNHTTNSYHEACGGTRGDVYCGELGTVEVAKERCCADPQCDGFSYYTSQQGGTKGKPVGYGCLKSNHDCGITAKRGLDGYTIATSRNNHSVPRNHSDSAAGLNVTFHFRAVGFAPDTLVRVRDLFAHVDLGVFTEQYTVEVPLHGAQMLHLAYEPKFHGSHTEL